MECASVKPTRGKSWALRYRFKGKAIKLTLGRWTAIGVADARAPAPASLDVLDHGRDPAGEKKAKAGAADQTDRDKMAAVIDLFLKRYVSHNRRGDDVAAMFRREVRGLWGGRDIHSITKRDVIDVLDGILDRGSPVTANRLRAHLPRPIGKGMRRSKWCAPTFTTSCLMALIRSSSGWHITPQKPGKKIGWAPVIVDVEGDGKTSLGEALKAAMGPHVADVSSDELKSDFSERAQGKAVRVMEEIKIDGERRATVMDKLKPKIANAEVRIVPKGKSGGSVVNVTNYIALTNHMDA